MIYKIINNIIFLHLDNYFYNKLMRFGISLSIRLNIMSRLSFMALLYFSLLSPLYGMENNSIIKQYPLPSTFLVTLFQFISDEKILLRQTLTQTIQGNNDFGGIIDLNNHNTFESAQIIQPQFLPKSSIAKGNKIVHFNHTNIQLYLYDGKIITNKKLIDSHNHKGLTNKYLRDCQFGSEDNTLILLLQDKITEELTLQIYNYKTENSLQKHTFDYCRLQYIINPLQKTLCTLNEKKINIYNSSDLQKKNSITLSSNHHFLNISADNKLAAIDGLRKTISLIDSNHTNEVKSIKAETKEMFSKICFNPTGGVLATLSLGQGFKYTLKYWDTKTLNILENQSLEDMHIFDINFSPNGRMLTIADKNKLTSYHVPFKVQYNPDLTNKFSFLLYVINQFTAQNDESIPNDIKNLIKWIYFLNCKR